MTDTHAHLDFLEPEELAEAAAADARDRALETMHRTLEAEARRVQELARTNDHVDPAELEMLAGQRNALAAAIGEARLRPDALRLVWQGPVRNGAPLATKGKG